MFKNLTPYRLTTTADLPDTAWLQQQLAQSPFTDCLPSQAQSTGWLAPRGRPQAPLVDSVGGQQLALLQIERKLLPAAVVRRRVEQLAAKVEHDSGRKPGAKRKRELKEQATHELLPRAFSRRSGALVWIDPGQQLLLVDAASPARADAVVTQLVHDIAGLAVAPLSTALAPAAAMADWLAGAEPPSAFSVDRDCELRSDDENRAVVRYARHRLDTDEVRRHITDGKRPTRLALTWRRRVSFTLLASGQLKGIELLDVVLDGRDGHDDDADAAFDADAAIATAELAPLLQDLIEALGGENLAPQQQQQPEPAAVAG